MSTVYLFEWIGVTSEQYQILIRELHWEQKASTGNIGLIQGAKKHVLLALSTWDLPQAFDQFYRTKFHRALLKAGLGQPVMKSWPVPGSKGETCNGHDQAEHVDDLPAAYNHHLPGVYLPHGSLYTFGIN